MKRLLFLAFTLIIPIYNFAFEGADTVLIKKHLSIITKTGDFRNHQNVGLLNKTAA